jgi:hypothetical protein
MKSSLLSVAAALVLAAAGCGGSEDGAPSSAAPIPGGGLSVEEALASTLEGPLAVAGYLVEVDGELRLCSAILESDPPQCGEPSLEVRGAADRDEVGERVSLVGEVEDGVITVSETTQA